MIAQSTFDIGMSDKKVEEFGISRFGGKGQNIPLRVHLFRIDVSAVVEKDLDLSKAIKRMPIKTE